MTRQKSFKNLVRQRMLRTGESYTTARRHVIAAQHRSGPSLGGYPVVGGGSHHESTLLHNLLRAHGVTAPHTGEPYSEAMLTGLGGGIGFLYAVFEYQGFPYPTMTVVAQHHPEPFVSAALTRLGVPFDVATTGSPTVAAKRLAALDGPALCLVDRAALPWHGVDGEFGAEPYEVAVISANDDTVFLDDQSVRPLELSRAEFLAAWSAPRKAKHRLLTVTGTGTGTPDLRSAIADAVATTVGHLTGPVLGHAFDVNFGLSGMGRLVDALGDRSGKRGWSSLFGESAGLFWALRRLHDCLELEYTAPGATRPLYADFLDEAAEAVGLDAYREAALLYREAGVRWSAVAAEALSATPVLLAYDELVEHRLALRIGGASVAEIRSVSAEIAGLPDRYPAEDPLDSNGRDGLLDRLHAHAAAALALEHEAVSVLR